jgi:hypothetical protein
MNGCRLSQDQLIFIRNPSQTIEAMFHIYLPSSMECVLLLLFFSFLSLFSISDSLHSTCSPVVNSSLARKGAGMVNMVVEPLNILEFEMVQGLG